jgi:hypothetical protein
MLPSLGIAMFCIFLGTGPLNAAIVNAVPAAVRATAIAMELIPDPRAGRHSLAAVDRDGQRPLDAGHGAGADAGDDGGCEWVVVFRGEGGGGGRTGLTPIVTDEHGLRARRGKVGLGIGVVGEVGDGVDGGNDVVRCTWSVVGSEGGWGGEAVGSGELVVVS